MIEAQSRLKGLTATPLAQQELNSGRLFSATRPYTWASKKLNWPLTSGGTGPARLTLKFGGGPPAVLMLAIDMKLQMIYFTISPSELM